MNIASTNRAVGSLLVVLGIVAMGLGAWLFFQEPDPNFDLNAQRKVAKSTCQQALRASSFEPTGETVLYIQDAGLDDPRLTLTRASLAISNCLGYEISEFCFGNDCAVSGLDMKLRPVF